MRIPLTVLLAACAPKPAERVESFLDAREHALACAAARDAGELELQARVRDETLRAFGAHLRVRALGPDELGGTGDGTWVLLDVDLRGRPDVLPEASVDLVLRDVQGRPWTRCGTCDAAWVGAALTDPESGAVPSVDYATHSRSGGGLWEAAGALAKVFVLPLTIMLDMALLPAAILGDAPAFPLTEWLLDPSARPVRSLDDPGPAEGPTALVVLQAQDGAGDPVRAEVALLGRHVEGCELHADFEVPLGEGVALDAELTP